MNSGRYLKIYTDFRECLTTLGDAEKGRLFDAMLLYAERGEEPNLSGNERHIWPLAKMNIDRQRESYDAMCRRNKENRSATSGNDTSQAVTSGNEWREDKNKDNGKENTSPPIYPPQGGAARSDCEGAPVRQKYSDAFETFWKAYPSFRAANKAKCATVFGKIPKDQLPRLLESLDAHKKSQQWRDGIIPLALTWLNQRRWECSPPPPPRTNGRRTAGGGYEQRPVDEEALNALIINLDGGAE